MSVLVLLCVVSGFSHTMSAQYAFDQVVSGLKHRDPTTRLRAIELLREADYPEAAVPLAAVFSDPDDRVQLAAIDAERSLFMTRPVTRRRMVGLVIEVRPNPTSGEKQLALKVRAVPPQVLSGLTLALRDTSPNVRAAAIDLAALLGPQACRRPVGLRENTTDSGIESAEIVRATGDGEIVSLQVDSELCSQLGNAVIENINTKQVQLRRAAMVALGLLRHGSAMQALSDQLSYYWEQQGPDALAALEGLAGIGHPMSVSVFRQSLSSSNADLRRVAVEGIARVGDRSAVAELGRVLHNERSKGVLLAVHYANAKLGVAGDSAKELIAALRDPSLGPFAVAYLLDAVEPLSPVLAEALRSEDADLRRIVADILGFSGDPRVIPALEAATKDPDSDAALAARRAIDRIKLQ